MHSEGIGPKKLGASPLKQLKKLQGYNYANNTSINQVNCRRMSLKIVQGVRLKFSSAIWSRL